jgi:hypothetical protein
VNVTSPFDKELADLSKKLNGTFVFYGRERLLLAKRQSAQDANAGKAGAPAAAARAEAKAGAGYVAPSDLVRESQEEDFDARKLKDEELPEAMRAMTPEQRQAYLETKAKERAALQARIKELAAKRAEFVKQAMAERKLDDSRSLDRALRDTVKEQARAQGFQGGK